MCFNKLISYRFFSSCTMTHISSKPLSMIIPNYVYYIFYEAAVYNTFTHDSHFKKDLSLFDVFIYGCYLMCQ